MELDHRHHHVEQPDGRLHDQRREPRRRRQAVPVRRHPRRRRRRLHVVRQRAVHAEQRAALQHASSSRTASRSTASRHTLTFGASVEKYHSENVFFPGKQSAYVYNTLSDFYTDLNGYLANPNRTTSPVSLRRFQVRYTNIPGQEKPIQPLAVWYVGRLRAGRVAAEAERDAHGRPPHGRPEVRRHRLRQPQRGRADVPGRNRRGGPVQHRQAARPEAAVVAARRLQLGRVERRAHAGPRRHGRLHRQARLRLDLEPDWQHRHADRLHPGREHDRPAVQPEPGLLQAGDRDRRAGGERRPRGDRPGLHVPADVAQQHRRRPAGCRGA